MFSVPKSKLPRLAREFCQGRAAVFWTHTFEDRAQGWLDDSFHARFREVLLHACGRFHLACPCYVLMPDHWHLVWTGLTEGSDQSLATAFLRKHLKPALDRVRLQDRAHDHVLREKERERGAFEAACQYVLHNPERAALRGDWREWPHLGAMISGYPDLDPRSEDFWEDFWKIYNRLVDGPCAPAQGYQNRSPLREERDAPPRGPRREPRDQTPGSPPTEDPCAPAQGYQNRSPLREERASSSRGGLRRSGFCDLTPPPS